MEVQVAVGDASARDAPRRERPTAGVQEVTEFIHGSQKFLLKDFNLPRLLLHFLKAWFLFYVI